MGGVVAPHLLLCPLPLHGNGVVSPVVSLRAQHTHARLVLLAEELQQPLVLWTHSVLHVGHGLHQLVLGEAGGVGIQVLLAVRAQAHQAGLDCFGPPFSQADIAEDLLPEKRGWGRG